MLKGASLIAKIVCVTTFIAGCAGGGGNSIQTTIPSTNLNASASRTTSPIYCGRTEVTLTCDATGAVSSLNGRCHTTESWQAITSGETMTCTYTATGTYTPGCRVSGNQGIISDNVDTSVTVTALDETPVVDTASLPPALQDIYNSLYETRCPPMLTSLTLNPEAPAAGQAVTMTAEVFNEPDVTDDETVEVKIYYSVDGGNSWNSVQMEQQSNEITWVGQIPGQTSGTTVIYGIKAVDTSGNLYIEAVCEMNGSPLAQANYAQDDCVNSGNVALCESKTPRGCMFPLSQDDAPLNDADNEIPPDLDYWDYRIGYDDEKIYLDLAVEGKIYEGTISPIDIYSYVAKVINPDNFVSGGGQNSATSNSASVYYIPNIEIMGGALPENATECSFMYKNGETAGFNSSVVICAEQDNHLVFTLNRSAVGDNPSDLLEFISFNSHSTDLTANGIQLGDYSHFTNVRFISRSFTIQ